MGIVEVRMYGSEAEKKALDLLLDRVVEVAGPEYGIDEAEIVLEKHGLNATKEQIAELLGIE